MIDGQRSGGGRIVGDRAERDLRVIGREDINVAEARGILPILGGDLHDHLVLVECRIHHRNGSLAEGIVERVVEQLGGDAESCRGVAVIGQEGLGAVVLLVAVDIGQNVGLLQLPEKFGSPYGDVVIVVALQGVLVQGVARAAAGAKILRGLQVKRSSRDMRQLGPETVDDGRCAILAHVERLEGDEKSSGVRGRSATATGESHHVGDGRVGHDDLDHLLELNVHGLERGVLVGEDRAVKTSGILLREQSRG